MSSSGFTERQPMRRFSALARVLTVSSLVFVLAACTSPGESPIESTAPSASPASSDAPSTTPAAVPTLQPDASASDNLEYFNEVAATVIASDPEAGGRAFIDALSQGGFDKTQMEVGFDRTSVDLAADSVQWAVRFNDECLIGQYGPSSGGYHGIVAAILPTGTCLIGATRPIDW